MKHRKPSMKIFIDRVKKPSSLILIIVLIGSILLTTLAYRLVVLAKPQAMSSGLTTPIATAPVGALPAVPPVQNPSEILGIDAKPTTNHTGIYWVRIGYTNCGSGNLQGALLKNTIEMFHRQGTRVLLTFCQDGAHLFDAAPLFDASQGQPDAVQCGNEEMKNDPSVAFLHVSPENFARFYDLCQYEVHAIRPDIPVLLGSLDPHVGGVDTQPLLDQVNYLNQMQKAMNTLVHPGGHWDWRTQTLGLIDSWHNGWSNGSPDPSVNRSRSSFCILGATIPCRPYEWCTRKTSLGGRGHRLLQRLWHRYSQCGTNRRFSYANLDHRRTNINEVQYSIFLL